ncbi:hypothetical protein, partial [Streptomyces sp. NPDC001970]
PFFHVHGRTRTSVQMITRAAHLERNPVCHNALTDHRMAGIVPDGLWEIARPACSRRFRDLGYTGSLNLLYKYINQGRLEGDRITPSPRRLLDRDPPRKPARQGSHPSR